VDASLWVLFASAFVSSTILPGNSEIVLAAVLTTGGAAATAAVVVATLGNTLGGMTTYGIGRLLPSRLPESAAIARVRRYGPAALLFSWVPFIGDALCAAAGWLKLPVAACAGAMALGKLARYAVLAQALALL
jgi:membrane protein YqaA with SNARE-associated domain